MAEARALTLNVEKGPRKGESIECKRSRVIRIGRVVKGNTFAIKDPAISEKHISIQLLPDQSWSLTDLDTSNGTFLNDRHLDPLVPTRLHHGDVIKIGSQTSIRVHAVEEEEIVEVPEIGKRKRGRSKKVEFAEEEEIIHVPETGRKTRRGRPRKVDFVDEQLVTTNVRRTRGAARREALKVESFQPDKGEDMEVEVVSDTALSSGPMEEERKSGKRPCAPMEEERKSGKRPCAPMEEERKSGESPCAPMEEERKSGEGPCAPMEEERKSGEGPCAPMEEERKSGERPCAEKDIVGEVRDMCLETKEFPDVLDADPIGDGNGGVVASGDEEIEMEKMTLGQWFDRLEKCLPMMINDAAEEIIAEIRAYADRYNEYIRGK